MELMTKRNGATPQEAWLVSVHASGTCWERNAGVPENMEGDVLGADSYEILTDTRELVDAIAEQMGKHHTEVTGLFYDGYYYEMEGENDTDVWHCADGFFIADQDQ